MAYLHIELKNEPELLMLIRAADPGYKKRKATVWITTDVELHGTFWDGGTRYTYTAVNLATKRASGAPQYDPPQFGGPRETPRVKLPQGAAIVKTGIFCGKTASASIYLHPDDVARLLTAPVQEA